MSTPRAAVTATLRAAGCVFAEEEAQLLLDAATTPAELADMVARRVGGLPLEHILGWAEFCGLRIEVDPGVFVPRRRTEFLVAQAAALAAPGAVVLDLCCGTAAVGTALAAALGPVELYAVDVDPAATACARRNVATAGGRVFEGDLFAPLPVALRGRVDVLAVNAPYVPTAAIATMPPEAATMRRAALDGGADGLDVQRRVAAAARTWLAPEGHLLIETGRAQAARTVEAFTSRGLTARVATSDERDATVVIGRRIDRSSDQAGGSS